MLNMGNRQYRFTKEFSSPSLGNVWIGRVMTLPQKQGQKFMDAGLAVEHVEKKAEPKKVTVQNDGRGNAGAGKVAPARNAK